MFSKARFEQKIASKIRKMKCIHWEKKGLSRIRICDLLCVRAKPKRTTHEDWKSFQNYLLYILQTAKSKFVFLDFQQSQRLESRVNRRLFVSGTFVLSFKAFEILTFCRPNSFTDPLSKSSRSIKIIHTI